LTLYGPQSTAVIIVTKFRFGSLKFILSFPGSPDPTKPRGVSVAEASQAFLKDRQEAPVTFSLLLASTQPGGATATRYKFANTVSGRKGDSYGSTAKINRKMNCCMGCASPLNRASTAYRGHTSQTSSGSIRKLQFLLWAIQNAARGSGQSPADCAAVDRQQEILTHPRTSDGRFQKRVAVLNVPPQLSAFWFRNVDDC